MEVLNVFNRFTDLLIASFELDGKGFAELVSIGGFCFFDQVQQRYAIIVCHRS